MRVDPDGNVIEDDANPDSEEEESEDAEESEDEEEEDEEGEEEEDDSEDPNFAEDLVGGKKLAGVFESVPALEKAYKNLQSYADKRRSAADRILSEQGYTWDKRTGQYVQSLQGPSVGTAKAKPADPADDGEATPTVAEPLEFLDHEFLDEEARRNNRLSERNWPVDRYGAEVVDDDAWDDLAARIGWSESEKARAIAKYERRVNAIREAGFRREQATFANTLSTWETGQAREAESIATDLVKANPHFPEEAVKRASEHFVGIAKQTLQKGVEDGRISRADMLRPNTLTGMMEVVIGRANRTGEWTRVLSTFASEVGNASSKKGRVVSTRIVSPGEETGSAAIPTRNGAREEPSGVGTPTLDSLSPRQRGAIEEWAKELGIKDTEAFAKEAVANGRFRRAKK